MNSPVNNHRGQLSDLAGESDDIADRKHWIVDEKLQTDADFENNLPDNDGQVIVRRVSGRTSRVAARFEAGNIWISQYLRLAPHIPFFASETVGPQQAESR